MFDLEDGLKRKARRTSVVTKPLEKRTSTNEHVHQFTLLKR